MQHLYTDGAEVLFGTDGWAAQVRLPAYGRADVVVDPEVAVGLPLVINGGARVEDLVDRFLAGDEQQSTHDHRRREACNSGCSLSVPRALRKRIGAQERQSPDSTR